MDLFQSLTDEEIEELDSLLLESSVEADSMDISMLDGLLTAVVSGPNVIIPSDWLPWVWDCTAGEERPQFASTRQAKRFHELVLRHMNDIQATLMGAPDQFELILMENPNGGNPIQILDEWCMGYMTGINLDLAGWAPLRVEHPDWFFVLQRYGTEAGWDIIQQNPYDLDVHMDYVHQLPLDVRKIHQYWLIQRQQQKLQGRETPHFRSTPMRAEEKIGRNDPCPCGSGKKFKACHGSPGRLH